MITRIDWESAEPEHLQSCIISITSFDFFNALHDEMELTNLMESESMLEFVPWYSYTSHEGLPTDLVKCRAGRNRYRYATLKAVDEAAVDVKRELDNAQNKFIQSRQTLIRAYLPGYEASITDYLYTPVKVCKYPTPPELMEWEKPEAPVSPIKRKLSAIDKPERARTIRCAKPIPKGRRQTTLKVAIKSAEPLPKRQKTTGADGVHIKRVQSTLNFSKCQ